MGTDHRHANSLEPANSDSVLTQDDNCANNQLIHEAVKIGEQQVSLLLGPATADIADFQTSDSGINGVKAPAKAK